MFAIARLRRRLRVPFLLRGLLLLLLFFVLVGCVVRFDPPAAPGEASQVVIMPEPTVEPVGEQPASAAISETVSAPDVAATNEVSETAETTLPTSTALSATQTTAEPATTTSAAAPATTTGRLIRIGYVTPQSGPLAAFAEADEFILAGIRAKLVDGIVINGVRHPVEILVEDSQSDPQLAAAFAKNLIMQDKVDLMLVSSTPETTNPVSEQCEKLGTPCISTVAPWQPWYFRDLEKIRTGYNWTYHFFWGLEDIIPVFINIWDASETNKVVGALWPNDGDGLAWSSLDVGFPPALEAAGYTVIDPGRYENMSGDFSKEIARFKDKNVEIVTGVLIPPDLATFLQQANAQGFYPKVVTVGKAALFPSVIESLPDNLGDGVSSEIWWSPNHPFQSSLLGVTAGELAADYTATTGKQWTQPIGFVHALFEVAVDVLQRTEDIEDHQSVVEAIKTTNLPTIVGVIDWQNGPTPNVAKTPLVGGQWVAGQTSPFDLLITSNRSATMIPANGATKPMPWSQ